MNARHNSAPRFTYHVLRIISAFCFLLSAFPLPAQVWITNSLTISETNASYEGQDLIISGSGVTVAMDVRIADSSAGVAVVNHFSVGEARGA